MFIISCNSHHLISDDDELGTVLFTAELPKDTRAYGNASNVDVIYADVFDKNGKKLFRTSSNITSSDIRINISLAKGNKYDVIFWAQNSTSSAYDTSDLSSIKMLDTYAVNNYDDAETMDAFFAVCKDVEVVSTPYSVELKRPLAQINVGTLGPSKPTKICIQGVATTFAPMDKSMSDYQDVTFSYPMSDQQFMADGNTYNYLAMAYVFAPILNEQVLDVELTFDEGQTSEKSITLSDIHIQANKKSNIIGALTQ